MLVHVVKPGGARFEYSFRDGTPDSVVLQQLAINRAIYGRTGKTTRANPDTGVEEQWDDPAAPWAWDSPDLVVAVGRATESGFVEVRRIKGPPAAPAGGV